MRKRHQAGAGALYAALSGFAAMIGATDAARAQDVPLINSNILDSLEGPNSVTQALTNRQFITTATTNTNNTSSDTSKEQSGGGGGLLNLPIDPKATLGALDQALPIDPKATLSALDQALLQNGLRGDLAGAVYQTLATLGQTFATAGVLASSITQNIIAAALDGKIVPDSGPVSPVVAASGGVPSSTFMVSGYRALSHDGFSISSPLSPASSKTPGFDEQDYGLTIATRFDVSHTFGAQPGIVTLGVIGNYTHTDIDVKAPDGFGGFSNGGSADIDSWSAGLYGLVTNGVRYGLITVTGTYGTPQTDRTVIPASAEFNSVGVATSAMAGVLVPMGGTTKLDLRGGLNYVYATSDDYRDSLGTSFTDARMQEFSGTASARLFSRLEGSDYNIRPFLQGGLTYRFHYENELQIDAVQFSFNDADTSVFARAGFDFDIGQATQAYLAVRGDASEDFRAIAAQVGVTFKLD